MFLGMEFQFGIDSNLHRNPQSDPHGSVLYPSNPIDTSYSIRAETIMTGVELYFLDEGKIAISNFRTLNEAGEYWAYINPKTKALVKYEEPNYVHEPYEGPT